MSFFLAFAGFAALIILHEFGHFVAAKAVGMRVERFALFFPPLVAKWRPKNSETEYGIGAIPLGGYVKITGMNPEEVIAPEVAHRAYFRQPVWKRIVVIAAGPAVNIVLAFLILWVLFASRPMPHVAPIVERVEKDSPAAGCAVRRRPDRLRRRPAGLRARHLREDRREARRGDARAIAGHSCAGKERQGCAAT